MARSHARTVEWVVSRLESALRGGRGSWAQSGVVRELMEAPGAAVVAGLSSLLSVALSECWERGWQPADIDRIVSKELDRRESDLVRHAIVDQSAEYRQWGVVAAPRWIQQVEALAAGRGLSKMDAVSLRAAIQLVAFLRTLPAIPILEPPPSRWPELERPREGPPPRLDGGLLERIRALLAKAESTDFDAEAEAFTAKAQELMTRHRIDRAVLEASASSGGGGAIGRRVGIDNPYPEAKTLLLGGIAEVNACRAVWTKPFGFATVFGHPEDVDGVEELYTSLLLQANSAMRREGPRQDVWGRSSTRRFRRSFLIGFAARIGQRLQEENARTVQSVEAETGTALVPLLDARLRAADQAMRQSFGRLDDMSLSASDREGYELGVRAANQAELTSPAGHLVR